MGRPIAAVGHPRGLALLLLALVLGTLATPGALAAPPLRNDGRGGREPAATAPAPPTTVPAEPAPTHESISSPAGPDVDRDAPPAAAPKAHVRRKPAPRPYAGASKAAAEVEAGEDPDPNGRGELRLDDPVLRWLPEILAATEATGTPASLIAAVIHVESSGDPNAVSPAGARGLMQIMPGELRARDIPSSRWHDPATNIRTGARILAERKEASGSWQRAVARYFGAGCDVLGTCTNGYVRRVFAAARHYDRIIRAPAGADLTPLPADWEPPAIKPVALNPPPAVEAPPAGSADRVRRERAPRAERIRAADDPDPPSTGSDSAGGGEDAPDERADPEDRSGDAAGQAGQGDRQRAEEDASGDGSPREEPKQEEPKREASNGPREPDKAADEPPAAEPETVNDSGGGADDRDTTDGGRDAGTRDDDRDDPAKRQAKDAEGKGGQS